MTTPSISTESTGSIGAIKWGDESSRELVSENKSGVSCGKNILSVLRCEFRRTFEGVRLASGFPTRPEKISLPLKAVQLVALPVGAVVFAGVAGALAVCASPIIATGKLQKMVCNPNAKHKERATVDATYRAQIVENYKAAQAQLGAAKQFLNNNNISDAKWALGAAKTSLGGVKPFMDVLPDVNRRVNQDGIREASTSLNKHIEELDQLHREGKLWVEYDDRKETGAIIGQLEKMMDSTELPENLRDYQPIKQLIKEIGILKKEIAQNSKEEVSQRIDELIKEVAKKISA